MNSFDFKDQVIRAFVYSWHCGWASAMASNVIRGPSAGASYEDVSWLSLRSAKESF